MLYSNWLYILGEEFPLFWEENQADYRGTQLCVTFSNTSTRGSIHIYRRRKTFRSWDSLGVLLAEVIVYWWRKKIKVRAKELC